MIVRPIALVCGLLAAFPAMARNQVWNQATWVVNAGAGSDTATYGGATAIMNGQSTACSIAVKVPDISAAVTITQVQAGEVLPIAVTQVMATNTTCNPVFVLGTSGN